MPLLSVLQMKVVGPDTKPVANETVYLFIGGQDNSMEKLMFTTDQQGFALFSLNTSLWKNSVTMTVSWSDRCCSLRSRTKTSDPWFSLQGTSQSTLDIEPYNYEVRKPEYVRAFLAVTEFYSKSKSFLKLLRATEGFTCDGDASVRAQYIIQGEELKEGQDTLDFFYLVRVPSSTDVLHEVTWHDCFSCHLSL